MSIFLLIIEIHDVDTNNLHGLKQLQINSEKSTKPSKDFLDAVANHPLLITNPSNNALVHITHFEVANTQAMISIHTIAKLAKNFSSYSQPSDFHEGKSKGNLVNLSQVVDVQAKHPFDL